MVTPTVVVLLVMSVFALIFTFYYSFTDYYYISLEALFSMGWITISPFLKDPYFIKGHLEHGIFYSSSAQVVETVYGLGMGCLCATG